MSNYTFVTSFSQKGYHVYGQAFIDSFIEHCDPHKLVIYHESQPNVDFHDRLTWRNLDHDEDRTKFIQDHGNDKHKVGTARDPNSQAIRFCHKIFAITDAIRKSLTEWVVWVDADVEWQSPLRDAHLSRITPADMDLAFLGRTSAPYTECGFVAYRAASTRVMRMAEDMRSYYTSDEIFSRPKSDWHDSRCFDICRQRSNIPTDRQNNLAREAPGWHVWPKTILSQFCVHHKGPARKHHAYKDIAP